MEKQKLASMDEMNRVVPTQPILHLLGTRCGERHEIRWGDNQIYLTPKCFKFLAKMGVVAAVQPDRWIRREELERGENQARYLYRLKHELESQCAELPVLWENNRRGAYRLTLPAHRVSVNWSSFDDSDDYDLIDWTQQFRPDVPHRESVSVPDHSGSQAAA
jgi:hypothetical protein